MKLSTKEIQTILPSGFKLVLDREYTAPTDAEVQEVVLPYISKRGDFKWSKDSADCDNASWMMVAEVSGKGWPFGLAILPDHAVCVYVNDKREYKFVDPYTGAIMETDKRLKVTVMP